MLYDDEECSIFINICFIIISDEDPCIGFKYSKPTLLKWFLLNVKNIFNTFH